MAHVLVPAHFYNPRLPTTTGPLARTSNRRLTQKSLPRVSNSDGGQSRWAEETHSRSPSARLPSGRLLPALGPAGSRAQTTRPLRQMPLGTWSQNTERSQCEAVLAAFAGPGGGTWEGGQGCFPAGGPVEGSPQGKPISLQTSFPKKAVPVLPDWGTSLLRSAPRAGHR